MTRTPPPLWRLPPRPAPYRRLATLATTLAAVALLCAAWLAHDAPAEEPVLIRAPVGAFKLPPDAMPAVLRARW